MFGINNLMLIGIIGAITCLPVRMRLRLSIGLTLLGLILLMMEVLLYLWLNTTVLEDFVADIVELLEK